MNYPPDHDRTLDEDFLDEDFEEVLEGDEDTSDEYRETLREDKILSDNEEL